MAYENGILDQTFTVSGNNLSATTDQFIFVKMGATAPQVVAAAANDDAVGISQDTNTDGNGVAVRVVGVSKLRLGGTVSSGNLLKPDANGNGVLHVGNSPACAKALDDGVANDVIPVLVIHTAAAT